MAVYRIDLTPDDNGTVLATCRVLPEVTTWGETQAEALQAAVGAVEEALAARISDGREVPAWSAVRAGEHVVHLPALTAVKVSLYRSLAAAGLTRAELGRRLGWHREQVDRLFRLDHASRLDQLEEAFKALGYRLDLGEIVRAA